MKIVKSGSNYIIEPEDGDTPEQILVEAIKLFMKGIKDENLEICSND